MDAGLAEREHSTMRDGCGRAWGIAVLLGVASGCGISDDRAPERLARSAQAITEVTLVTTVVADDPKPAAALGTALALDGDRLVLGAPGIEAAYVFARAGDAWIQEAKLIPAGFEPGGPPTGFGQAVAIDGDRVVVGQPSASLGAIQAGAAHVFARVQGAWKEESTLVISTPIAGDLLGTSVAIAGDEILLGASQNSGFGSGFVSLFRRQGAAWVEQPTPLAPSSGTFGDSFGISAALDGDAALIGAYFSGGPGFQLAAGAAYVYRRSSDGWAEEARLTANDPTASAFLGRSVALDGDTALVGAPALVDFAHGSGAAYVFHRGAQGWEQEAKLVADDGGAFDELGVSVALAGDVAVVGSDHFHDGKGPGAAYLFRRTGHTWILQGRIDPTENGSQERTGAAVAIQGQTVIVGAPQSLSDPGQAYVYRVALAKGEPCGGAAECASGFCVDGVCCDTACGGGDPSDCQACSTAFQAKGNGVCLPLEADVICRASGGPCDGPQTCDGTSLTCPATPPPGATCAPPDAGPMDGGAEANPPPSTGDGCTLRGAGPSDSPRDHAGWALLLALVVRAHRARRAGRA